MGYHEKQLEPHEGLVYHVGLHSLAVLGSPLVDVLSGRVGAHKADGFDGRVVTDEVHRCTKTQTDTVNPLFFICAATVRHKIRAERSRIEGFKSSNTRELLPDISCT